MFLCIEIDISVPSNRDGNLQSEGINTVPKRE